MLKLYYHKHFIEAGCDEAGRGCLAGPVYAAAVILPKNYKNKWLNDSKQLTEADRYDLRPENRRKSFGAGGWNCYAPGNRPDQYFKCLFFKHAPGFRSIKNCSGIIAYRRQSF